MRIVAWCWFGVVLCALVGVERGRLSAQTLSEDFSTDPFLAGRFTETTVNTESSFTYDKVGHDLLAVLDVDSSPASYLSQPFPDITDGQNASFSIIFKIDAVDDEETPTVFAGFGNGTHVEMGGNGLTMTLATTLGTVVAAAAIDDDGTGQTNKGKFVGPQIQLTLSHQYYAVGTYVAAVRQWTIQVYDGPTFTHFQGISTAQYPIGRQMSVNRLGLQNGGGRITDQVVGSITLRVSHLDSPGHAPVFISVADTSVQARQNSQSTALFSISLSAPSTAQVSVGYTTVDGTAKAGTDYLQQSSTINFPPGVTNQIVAIPVLAMAAAGPSLNFGLALSAAINATLVTSNAVATILNGSQPVLTVGDAAVLDQSGATNRASFPVWLSTPSTLPVSVNYVTSDGSARAGSDYDFAAGSITFLPGVTNQTISVNVRGDTLNKPTEVFFLYLSSPANAVLGNSQAQGTILNHNPVPVISAQDTVASEGGALGGLASFLFTLSNPSVNPIGVQYATADETAIAGVNYRATAGTVFFPPGFTSQSVTVPVYNDGWHRGELSFILKLSNPLNALLATNKVRATILGDNPLPEIVLQGASVLAPPDRATNLIFLIQLTRPSVDVVTVDCRTVDGSASAGVDFQTVNETLTFPAGVTNIALGVVINPQSGHLPPKTFSVELSGPVNATLRTNSAIGNILTQQSPTLSIADASVVQPFGVITDLVFAVTLWPPALSPVSVTYSTVSGSAVAGRDFVAVVNALSFATGITNQSIHISLLNGGSSANSALYVDLSNPVNAQVGRLEAVGNILHQPPPAININDVQLPEGDVGYTPFVFTLTLSAPSDETVAVDYFTRDDVAIGGKDYVPISGTIVFRPGQTTQSVSVLVIGNTLYEPDKDFFLQLTNPAYAILSTNHGTGTILNDDLPPTITVPDAHFFGCESGTSTIDFQIHLSQPSGEATTFTFNTADNSAVAGRDYVATNGQIVIPAGTADVTIPVTVLCHSLDSSGLSFWLDFDGGGGGGGDGGGAQGLILNDQPPKINTRPVSVIAPSGVTNYAVVPLSLSYRLPQSVTVDYATSDLSAIVGLDYLPGHGTAVFPAGVTNASIKVPVIGNGTNGQTKTFALTFFNPINAILATNSTICTIIEGQLPRVSVADANVAEGDFGRTNMLFALTLNQASTQPVAVDYATSDASATAGIDYDNTHGTVVFDPGTISQIVAVPVIGNLIPQADRTFILNLSNPLNGTLARSQAQGLIQDDDAIPKITLLDHGQSRPTSAISSLSVPVSLSVPSGLPVSVHWETHDGSAVAGFDYLARSGTLSFSPGITNLLLNIPMLPAATYGPNQTFVVLLSNPTNSVIARGQAIITLININPAPTITVDALSVLEGNTGVRPAYFNLHLSAPSSLPVALDFNTADSTAIAGADYISTNGTIQFPPGTTNQAVPVGIIGNTIVQSNRTFLLELSNAVGGTLARSQAIGTIVDDDNLTLRINNVSKVQDVAVSVPLPFKLSLSGPCGEPVTVDYATADQTAVAGVDYVGDSGHLTFAPGATNLTLNVMVLPNPLHAPTKTFTVNLSNSVGVRQLVSPGIGTIINIGPPGILISDETVNAGLGDVTATFTIRLTSVSTNTVTVDYTTANGTAAAGSDYDPATGQLTFVPGVTNLTITVHVKGSTVDKPTVTFYLNLFSAVNAVIGRPSGLGTILNNVSTNSPPFLSAIPDQTVNENTLAVSVPFVVSDLETPVDSLILDVNAADPVFMPKTNLVVSGLGTNRILTITIPPNTAGQTKITVSAKDGGGLTAETTFLLTVRFVNVAPSFIRGPDVNISQNAGPQTIQNWSGAISAGPASESSQHLSFFLTNNNPGLFLVPPALATNGTLSFAPFTNSVGAATVSVILKDDGGTDNGGKDTSAPQLFTITVQAVNHPPVLSPIDPQTIWEGQLLTFTARATDTDVPRQTLTFSLGPDAPAGATINPASGVFSWTPPVGLGTRTVTLTINVRDDGPGTLGDSKTVSILVKALGQPQAVLTKPLGGSAFSAGANILIQAQASSPNGAITNLEFLQGGAQSLAIVTNSPYSFIWSNVPFGSYALAVRVTDALGVTAISPTVNIVVTNPPSLAVAIVAPLDFDSFCVGTSVPISAVVTNATTPTRVDFFAGDTLLGSVTSNAFDFVWTAPPPGDFFLLARATDTAGNTVSSKPVRVLVASPCDRVAIVPGSADPEIGQLQQDLYDMKLGSRVIPQETLSPAALVGFSLVIWDGLSSGTNGPSVAAVDAIQSAYAAGIPLYFIGERLASSSLSLPQPEQSSWNSLTHLGAPRGTGGDGTVLVQSTLAFNPIQNGLFGNVSNFYYPPVLELANNTDSNTEVMGTSGSADVLLAYPGFQIIDTGQTRIFTQAMRVTPTDAFVDTNMLRSMFQNTVYWLLRVNWCVDDDMFLQVSTTPVSGQVGQPLEYDIQVIRNGECPAMGVVMTNSLPPGVQFVSGKSQQGTWIYDPLLRQISFFIGHVDLTDLPTLSITVVPLVASPITNVMGVYHNGEDVNPLNNTLTIITEVQDSGTALTPRLLINRTTSNGYELRLNGAPNVSYELDGSTDLTNWTAVNASVQPGWSASLTLDTNSSPRLFYRARIAR